MASSPCRSASGSTTPHSLARRAKCCLDPGNASAPFVSWPVMHTRYSQAVNFVGRERTQLSYVLVRPQPGVEAKELCRRIEAQTGLRVRTNKQFQWDCIRYYLKNTGIPVNFGITI